jgi:hypothetical protein
LRATPSAVDDGWAGLDMTLERLPGHPDDLDWGITSEVLLQDHDILTLFDIELDGAEDLDTESTRRWAWVTTGPERGFAHSIPQRDTRDPRRRFRR